MGNKKVLITIPLRNRGWCIEGVLNSLKEQTYSKDEIGIYFLLNDSTDDTEKKLKEFKQWNDIQSNPIHFKDVIIEQMDLGNTFDGDHQWSTKTFKRIIKLRNHCLKQIKDYDFIFMLDSDTWLNPKCIEHLVSLDKDIVTENGWATWNLSFSEAIPFMTESKKNFMWTLNMKTKKILENPGTYDLSKVKQLRSGGCVLIKKEVIESGVDYTDNSLIDSKGLMRELKELSVSSYDELTAFNKNRMKAGFEHWVDTKYECYSFEQYKPINTWTKTSESLYKTALKKLMEYDEIKTVLDVGNGVGFGSNILSEKFDVTGFDMDKRASNLGKLNYPHIDFIQGDFRKYEGKKYDAVVCCEMIEHVPFIRDVFENIKKAVKPNGFVFISTPNSVVFPRQPSYHLHRFYKEFFDEIVNEYLDAETGYLLQKNKYTKKLWGDKEMATNLIAFGKFKRR